MRLKMELKSLTEPWDDDNLIGRLRKSSCRKIENEGFRDMIKTQNVASQQASSNSGSMKNIAER